MDNEKIISYIESQPANSIESLLFEEMGFKDREKIIKAVSNYIDSNSISEIPGYIIPFKEFISLYSELLKSPLKSVLSEVSIPHELNKVFQRFIYSLFLEVLPGKHKRVDLELYGDKIRWVKCYIYDDTILLRSIRSNVIKELGKLGKNFNFVSLTLESIINDIAILINCENEKLKNRKLRDIPPPVFKPAYEARFLKGE